MLNRHRRAGALLSSAALVAAAALTLGPQVRTPEATAAPATSTATTTATATSAPTSTSAASSPSGSGSGAGSGSAADYPTDAQGFLDSAARCDDSQTLMSYGRTSRALVAICVDPDGELEYRGVRLSDETSLTAPAGRASDGSIVATNDGATYAVSPEMLLVSDGDNVLYRDSWLEFRQPRFAGEPTATTSTSTATPSATPTSSENSAPTVSTTTVTVTPNASNSGY